MGRKKKNKGKEKVRYSKIIVSIILANTFLFSWAMLLVFYFKGIEPAVLIEWYYKIIVGELGLMAFSKVFELWKGKGEINDLVRNSGEGSNSVNNDDSIVQDITND